MLEHGSAPVKAKMVEELHAYGANLYSDQYGNYVTQHIIERGAPQDRERVIAAILSNLEYFSKHKFASNVVEKCLVSGSEQHKRAIMLGVMQPSRSAGPTQSVLSELIKDAYGNYVVQSLLNELNDADHVEFTAYLSSEVAKLKRATSSYGKQIAAVEKKMHRIPGMRPALGVQIASNKAQSIHSVSSAASVSSPTSAGADSETSLTSPASTTHSASLHLLPSTMQFGSFPMTQIDAKNADSTAAVDGGCIIHQDGDGDETSNFATPTLADIVRSPITSMNA